MKVNHKIIPKGYRQIRVGEILPEGHQYFRTHDKKWVLDGEIGEKWAGKRRPMGIEICITKK